MKRPLSIRSGLQVAAQVAAVWADLEKANRARELADVLSDQDRAFLDAMSELEVVHDFVGSSRNILGREDTKHGEIAEQVHVGVTRAWDALHARARTATFEGVPRTGPVDYRVDGVDIQSKYYNGLRNTLRGVASHAEKYPDFSDGGGRYHVPRDQHLQWEELRRTGGILSTDSPRRSTSRPCRKSRTQTGFIPPSASSSSTTPPISGWTSTIFPRCLVTCLPCRGPREFWSFATR